MRMFYSKIAIAESERGLLFRRGSFVRVLDPGVHRIESATAEIRVDRFDITNPVFDHPLGEFLVKTRPELREERCRLLFCQLTMDDLVHLVDDGPLLRCELRLVTLSDDCRRDQ